MTRYTAGKEGLTIALVAAAVMAAFSIADPLAVAHAAATGGLGICAPAPAHWVISAPLSWLLNMTLVIAVAFALLFANKKLAFIQGQDLTAPALFLIFTAAAPQLTSLLNSSTLVCAANLACIYLILNAYEKTNATQDLFLVATIASLGVMIQYAFLLYIPVYLISAATLQLLRPKEIGAFLLGLIAPFWTLIGLGIVSFADFQLPHIESVFTNSLSALNLTFFLIEAAFAIAIGLYCTARNIISFNNLGIRSILFNRVILIFGGASLLFACIDFLNFRSYLQTIYLVAAIQAADTFEESKWPWKRYVLLSLGVVYITLFLCIITS